MVEIHVAVGILLLVLNLAAGIWGVICWLASRPSVAFWYLLRAAQTSVVLQAAIGAGLLLSNHKAADNLHYLYGIVPLGVALATESMRIGAAQRVVGEIDYAALPEADQRALAINIVRAETRVMALGALFIAAIAIRAATTSGGL